MTGFEPQISDVVSDRSINCTTVVKQLDEWTEKGA